MKTEGGVSVVSAWVRRAIVLIPPILVLAFAALSMLERRSLHADGAWAFLHTLLSEGYNVEDWTRIAANVIAQTPIAVAVVLGVSNPDLLQLLHGFGYLVIPALAWVAAMLLARFSRTGAFITLGYCATTLTSGFLAGAEYNVLFAFAALSFSAIIRCWIQPRRLMAWVALTSAVVVSLSHGLVGLLAPVLVLTIVLPWRRLGAPRYGRGALFAATMVLGVGFCMGVYSIARPYSPGNVAQALDLWSPVKENGQLLATAGCLALIGLAVLARQRWLRQVSGSVVIIGIVVTAAMEPLWATPAQQYRARAWSAILLALILLVALMMELSMQHSEDHPEAITIRDVRLSVLSITLMVGLLLPSVVQTLQFGVYMRSFDEFVNSRSGLVDNTTFMRAVPAAAHYGWPWTYPSMSLVVRNGPDGAMVRNPLDNHYLEPFAAEDPPSLPRRFRAD